VLLIDDEVDVLDATTATLKRWGLHVYPASTVQAANATLHAMSQRGAKPDVIVTDYRLGSDAENGLDLIRALRLASHTEIPAVLLTGDAAAVGKLSQDTRMPERCTTLSKPANAQQIQRAIAQLLG
jgi:CheY-like chemotaxis protein